MKSEHLRQGELSNLKFYFKHCGQTPIASEHRKFNRELIRDIAADNPELRAKLADIDDKARATAEGYIKRSSFGSSLEEITVNARHHIQSCLPCFQEYATKVIEDTVLYFRIDESSKRLNHREPAPFSAKKFLDRTHIEDYLGILKK